MLHVSGCTFVLLLFGLVRALVLIRACETPGRLQGFKTPSPEIPRKKLKNWPPNPDPKFLKKYTKSTKNTREILFSGILVVFLSIF